MVTGLFLSRDDGQISQTIDLDSLASQFDQVDVCKVYDNFFKPDDLKDMLETVRQRKVDAIVLAGNSPKHFDQTPNADRLLDSLDSLGVNRNKIAFANIKEFVALPHRGNKIQATDKARSLIDVALAKVQVMKDVKSIFVAPRRAVMVVGTTDAGLTTACQLLDKGFKVFIVDKEPSFRGDKECSSEILPSLSFVRSRKDIKTYFGTTIKDVSGWCGDYSVVLEHSNGEEKIDVGGIILTVGNDTDWIAELQPKMQLDTDAAGFIRSPKGTNLVGRTADPGVFFVPFCADDSSFASQAARASMAVLSLTTVLDKNEIIHPEWVTDVNDSLCGGCGTCVKTCAFAASKIDLSLGLSSIDVRRCKGCGNCVVSCPTGARNLVTFPEEYAFKAINILAEGVKDCTDPKILAILCDTSGYSAADAACAMPSKKGQVSYSPNVMPLRVKCGGSIDTQFILEAVQAGFDGVILCICEDCKCHYVVGNTDMERRLGLFREVLRSRNINADRLHITHLAPESGEQFIEELSTFSECLREMRG
jgi:heterodisulfide reductase subunit A-like polyferredoxin/coenzyme F420-reducing hydrogenase delta subunit